VTHDPRFSAVLGDAARLERVIETDAHEGPVYAAAEDALYFTTLPRADTEQERGYPEVSITRLALDADRFPLEPDRLSVIQASVRTANGMAADHSGALVVCQQGTPAEPAALVRVDMASGAAQTLVDNFRGAQLNSPNDVVVKSDGTIWFTDPSYGYLQGFRPQPELGDYVYRWEPATERLTVIADDFDKPNGLAFSADERTLYVTDSGANQTASSFDVTRPHHIRAYDVIEGRRLGAGRLFAVTLPGFPDGIKVDAEERVYASSFDGVHVFAPDGELIGEIALPGAVNFTFGGAGRNILFITTDTAIWAAVLQATGPRLPADPQQIGV
jgi:gluconolactonase